MSTDVPSTFTMLQASTNLEDYEKLQLEETKYLFISTNKKVKDVAHIFKSFLSFSSSLCMSKFPPNRPCKIKRSKLNQKLGFAYMENLLIYVAAKFVDWTSYILLH